MAAGLRVIRGPGWSQGEADGGEGHVGTVTGTGADGKVEVVWDGGQVTTVPAGSKQLLVLDNATIGVRHEHSTCDECSENGIVGMLWSCVTCSDFDLCSLCYFSDRHDTSHQFTRSETPTSSPETVGPRRKCKKIRVMGIYPEATVVRGRDWEWNDQDGGDGCQGRVVDLVTPAAHSARSTVKVEWQNGFKNVYRVGFKGKVDLKFTEESPGGECYPQHLPVFDPQKYQESATDSKIKRESADGIIKGDRVIITVGAEELQELQKARSGWAVGMAQCIGAFGEVKGFAANGDAIVDFGKGKKYRLVPGVLIKVARLSPGDRVRVMDDASKVRVLQDGHGGYNEAMSSALGKVGEVIKLDSDGDAVVQFGRQKWVYNPACLTPAPGQPVDEVEVEVSLRRHLSRQESSTSALNGLLGAMILAAMADQQTPGLDASLMLKAVIENDIANVKKLLNKDRDLANATEQGMTALHIAANLGSDEIVRLLVENGAKLNELDSDGDTPLIAGMKHEAVAKYLIMKGCDVSISNNNGQTAGHKAALFGHAQILRLLIERKADMNASDTEGDTPLHDAISQARTAAAEVLIGWPQLDIRRKNKKGFPPLHFAAVKGEPSITELLLKRDKTLIDEQKEDGFTPLHVAAINNHTDVMKVLLEKGKAKVDLRTVKKQTPLHVAAEEAYMDAVQLLIQHGADVNAKDADGDRPLHILMGSYTSSGPEDLQLLMTLLGQTLKVKAEERVRIACYLLQAGAEPEARNNIGKTAMEVCGNPIVSENVKRFLDANPALSKPQRPKTPALVREMSESAINLCRKCCTRRADILLVPCGHKAACRACCTKDRKLSECPQCGRHVSSMHDQNGKEIGKGCSVM